MKVLIATPYYFPRVGGLENYAQAIAQGLHKRGSKVVVVCGDIGVTKVTRETRDGYTVYRLPIWKVVSNTPLHPGWYFMLRQIIRAERPDIVNAHTPVPYMIDMVTLAAGKVPVVATYHAATLFKPSGPLMKGLTYVYQVIQSVTLAQTSEIIAVSPYVKNEMGKRLAHKTQVVPNSVAEVADENVTRGTGLVFVANLKPTHAWKGLDLIIDGLEIAREVYGVAPKLTVIGDGSDRPRYEQRIKDLKLGDSVVFAGQLIGAARDKVVRSAVAQVLYPSTANDAMPTVLLEGWAQGLPVIAGAIGPIPSLVDDNETGVLVAPNDPVALAEAMHKMLANPKRAKIMGEAARQLVKREYTWPQQVERTALYFEALV